MHFEPAISQKEVWYHDRHAKDSRRGLKGQSRPGSGKGEKTITQIASEFSVHPNQIRHRHVHLLEILPEMFSTRKPHQEKAREELIDELFRQIGQLKIELDWLKKNLRRSYPSKAEQH